MKWLDRTALRLPFFALCLTPAAFKQAERKLKMVGNDAWLGRNDHATTHTYHNGNGGVACLVCLQVDKNRSRAYIDGILAHEATHIMQAFLESIGETHPGREEEAYAVGNITERLIAEYLRLGGK